MTPRILLSLTTSVAAVLAGSVATAQPQGKAGQYSDVTIQGTILEPRKIEVADDAELVNRLTVPDGFRVDVFARDLINPRMLAVSGAGHLYATRRTVGDVILLKDENGDGKADGHQTVASRPGMHGIAFHEGQVFLATANDVYVADVRDDGTFSELKRIINDLPDAGQHPNRTLAVGPDGMLYISVASTCNACDESNPESATLLRASTDGTKRTIFARGLRNTIGFGWEPQSGALYGFDHGIDWLGDDDQVEELNLIEQGKQYGWPYVYGMGELNPQDNPPEGMTLEQWAKLSEEPVLTYTAHSAPMQMTFHDGSAFPQDYRGDAFVAMRGSWNRRPPSGYEVLRVNFDNGKPAGMEPFLKGFLVEQQDGSYGFLGRPTGVAVGRDGGLFVADDSNGIIYRVSHGEARASTSASRPKVPDAVSKPPASDIAIKLVEPSKGAIAVSGPFEKQGSIPLAYVADGDNASPALSWSGAPEGAKSFVVMMDDPDAAEPKPFVHWILYDLPASVTSLREGLPTDPILPDPKGAKQGANSMGSVGYTGPKPPLSDPAHNYHFQVFALDIPTLKLDPGAKRDEVLAAMKGHVLAAGELVGTFRRGGDTAGKQ